jgi:hypothetical protein
MRIANLVLLVPLLLCASFSTAEKVGQFVGTWRGNTKIPSVLLKLKEHGDVLEGTITLFSLDGKKQESAISDVEVRGKRLEFVSADMNFSMTLAGPSRAVLHGKRRELDIEFQMTRGGYRGERAPLLQHP